MHQRAGKLYIKACTEHIFNSMQVFSYRAKYKVHYLLQQCSTHSCRCTTKTGKLVPYKSHFLPVTKLKLHKLTTALFNKKLDNRCGYFIIKAFTEQVGLQQLQQCLVSGLCCNMTADKSYISLLGDKLSHLHNMQFKFKFYKPKQA